MSKIVVLGGTGYAGGSIVNEAAARGHEVVAVSRSEADAIDGVTNVTGSVLDVALRAEVLSGAVVVIGALSPRGEMAGKVAELYKDIASEVAKNGTRFIVVGGFGSLRPAPGADRFVDGDDFPADYKGESLELASVLEYFQNDAAEELDWTYVSPAATFGAFNPGVKKDEYRTAGEVALFDEKGESAISGADFAAAIVDEIEAPKFQKQHLSIAY